MSCTPMRIPLIGRVSARDPGTHGVWRHVAADVAPHAAPADELGVSSLHMTLAQRQEAAELQQLLERSI